MTRPAGRGARRAARPLPSPAEAGSGRGAGRALACALRPPAIIRGRVRRRARARLCGHVWNQPSKRRAARGPRSRAPAACEPLAAWRAGRPAAGSLGLLQWFPSGLAALCICHCRSRFIFAPSQSRSYSVDACREIRTPCCGQMGPAPRGSRRLRPDKRVHALRYHRFRPAHGACDQGARGSPPRPSGRQRSACAWLQHSPPVSSAPQDTLHPNLHNPALRPSIARGVPACHARAWHALS